MKYLSVQREKSRKYSQRWQQQHTADELKTIAAAVNYLSEHSISTLDELDASLSSVSDKAYSIREGMKTAEQRMKELQKLMEYGRNYHRVERILSDMILPFFHASSSMRKPPLVRSPCRIFMIFPW